MSRRIEVEIIGDATLLKRMLGVPLTLVERVRFVIRAAARAWRRSGS